VFSIICASEFFHPPLSGHLSISTSNQGGGVLPIGHSRRALQHGDGWVVRGGEVPVASIDAAPTVPTAAGGEGVAVGYVGGAAHRVCQHRVVRHDHVCQQLPCPNHRLALRNSSSKNNFFIHEYGKLSTYAVQTMLLSQHFLILF
jgi:hypothetical protein